mmetsp:Transcript_27835/g.62673  ORF Transcript_27835/g.62673 Transcript_27835/m.62673 type:complete len:239 (+) Transcript_27835:44-760(+)
MAALSKLLELDVRLTRQTQSMSLGWLECLIYPGSMAFSWEGVGISLTALGLWYGFQPLWLCLFALCYGQLLNRVLKLSFQRERPVPPNNVKRLFRTIILKAADGHADGAAFPSGDTMAGSATGASLALAGCGSAWWLLGLYVGVGRVYFLAHHWLDIVAGYVEGCAVAFLASKVIHKHSHFELEQLLALLVAGVGFLLAMKMTKRLHSGHCKARHLILLSAGIGLLFIAPNLGSRFRV